MAPGDPEGGEGEEGEEVEVELSGPGHGGDGGEEEREEIPALAAADEEGIGREARQDESEIQTEFGHERFPCQSAS